MFYLSTNSKYHKRDLSHSQSLAFSSRPPPSFRERLRSVDVFFFSFRTCINFLLLYRVEINILFDWQSPDLNIWFTSRPIKSLHDNDVLTAGLLLLFSHLTDGRLLVRRMARAGETELRFKASTLRACYFFNSNFKLKICSKKRKRHADRKSTDFRSLIITSSGRKVSCVFTQRDSSHIETSFNHIRNNLWVNSAYENFALILSALRGQY